MGGKRLIIGSIISIFLVAILLIGSTYSIFTLSEVDQNVNVFKTGILDVTYTLSSENVTINNLIPISDSESIKVQSYRITVTNNGNVAYKFNLLLNDITASNVIDYQYIMIQVGKLTLKKLSACTSNILQGDIIVLPNSSVDIDVRVWISNTIPNSEIGKSFYGSFSLDGEASNVDETDVDNNYLIANLPLLNEVEVGSYVAYTGNNGCTGNSCSGQNANYVNSSNKGYCVSSSYKYTVSGWRIAYTKDDEAYLVSAGAPECMARTSSTENYAYIDAAETSALKYCNSPYVDYGCSGGDAWAIDDWDYYYMTKAINNGIGKRLTSGSSDLGDVGGSLGNTLFCDGQRDKVDCGYNNDLLDVGGFYWFASQSSSTSTSGVYWDPLYHTPSSYSSTIAYGLRPVIRLSSTVYVTGGSGTEDDPYTIAN